MPHQSYSLELYVSLNSYLELATVDKMKPGAKLYSITCLYFLAWHLSLGFADYVHRHEHSIQMRNYEHPWFGNNSIRFCAFNQYLDEHEGRCMIIPGGGTAISIDDDTTCDVEALRPHPSLPSSYYACRKTKTILAECKNGQRFENRLKRCAIDVTSSEDDYSRDEDSPEAYDHIHLPPCEKPGRFPVPQGNCTIFYACTSNGFRLFRTIYQCPPSTGFDPSTKMCSPEFACDSESDTQLTKINPKSETTTFCPRDADTTTTTRTFTTIAPPTIGLKETSPLDSSTLSSLLKKSTTSSTRSSDNHDYDSTTAMTITSTISGFNQVETTSTAPQLDLVTESKFLTTNDKIIGADQFLRISSMQGYENQETTPTYAATSTQKNVQTSEDASMDEFSGVQEMSTLHPVRNDQESTTITSEIFTVAETTLSNNSGKNEQTTMGYFTTVEPEPKDPSYLSEEPSQTNTIASTEKWLFDFNRTEVSTTMESSDPPELAETFFTTSSTLLNATEFIPITESSVIDATNTSELVPTSLLPETDAGMTSGEVLLNNLSTTTAEAETMSLFEESTGDSVTPPNLGGKWLLDVTRAEESSEILLTTTEIPARSVSSFIVDRKALDATETTTASTSGAETEVASDLSEIFRDNLLITSDDWETTTANILKGANEKNVTSTTVVNDYAYDGDFLESESSTENSSSDETTDDDKVDSVDTTAVTPESENLATLKTTFSEGQLRKSESTTENSWSSFSNAGSGDGFDTVSDPLESFLPSNESIENDETTDIYNFTTLLPVSRLDDEIASSPEKELNSRNYDDQTTILPENDVNTSGFNDETTNLPGDELKTGEINDETTTLSENELKTSVLNEETTVLPESTLTNSRLNERPSELPKDDSDTTSIDTVPEISSTLSYNSESIMTAREGMEFSSEVTDDVSTDATYFTSENPDVTGN